MVLYPPDIPEDAVIFDPSTLQPPEADRFENTLDVVNHIYPQHQ
jgi:hypothetical protein